MDKSSFIGARRMFAMTSSILDCCPSCLSCCGQEILKKRLQLLPSWLDLSHHVDLIACNTYNAEAVLL